MARILRGEKGWDIFPHLGPLSIFIGGFCGYHLGKMSAAYPEKQLLRVEREVDTARKKKDEDIRKVIRLGKEWDKHLRSIKIYERTLVEQERKLQIVSVRQEEKERALKKLEEELVQRERNVRNGKEGNNGI